MGPDVHANPLNRLVRGKAGRFGISSILMLLALAVFAYLAIKLVPPYIDNYKLGKAMQKAAAHARRDPEILVLQAMVLEESKRLGLGLTADDVVIERDPHNQWIEIRTRYIRRIALELFGTINLEFEQDVTERL
ncbi:MAG: hypothetical protein JXR96_03280 [Deltaproteobacteria bacterium]|nr:hypothetical protein [Deltaproteobacteria bacterium]